MSPRKPTIDGQDDIDDEDGVAEAEAAEETDLTLHEDPYLADRDEEDEA